MNRRSLLLGLGGILTAAAAPAIVRAGVLMPVRRVIAPRYQHQFLLDENLMMPRTVIVHSSPLRLSTIRIWQGEFENPGPLLAEFDAPANWMEMK